MDIQKRLDNIKLCIKYPFLYPRNRFTGKYRANILNSFLWKLTKKAFVTINVGMTHIKPGEHIPPFYTQELEMKAKQIFNKYDINYALSGNKFVLYNSKYRYDLKLNFNPEEYTVEDIKIRSYVSGNQHLAVQIFLRRKEEDKNRYGFGYQSQDFIVNSFYHKLYKITKWVDRKILDPICGLFPSSTELDAMDKGWRIAFGEQMCEEIKQALLEDGGKKMLKSYRILQIKEKYGYLRWYDAFTTEKVQKIIRKYEDISEKTCIVCGKPAKYRSLGWICPYCEEHIDKTTKYEELS